MFRLHALAFTCICSAGWTTLAAYTDGLVQYWDFSRGDTTKAVGTADIKDAMSWSSASPKVATRIDGMNPSDAAMALKVPDRVCYTNIDVQLPFYGGVTNARTCLFIPQEPAMDGSTKKYFSRQVRLPAPTALADFGPTTVFLRFCLEKQNGGTASSVRSIYSYGTTRNATSGGWGLTIQGGEGGWILAVSRGSCWYRMAPQEVNGKKVPEQGCTNPYIYANRWYDVVISVDPTTSTDNINLYVCDAGKYFRSSSSNEKAPELYHYRHSYEMAAPASAVANVQILGGDEDINGWGASSPTSWQPADYFNHGVWGAFERVMVWNRILTKEEAFDAMADATGRNVEIGAKNDLADEFGKTGSSALVAVYDVETNTWNQLRKELTSANPSVTLRFSVPAREVGLSRALTVDPVLSGTSAAVPVAVTVNGQDVGVMDLANESKRTLFIPGSFMSVDADGKTTVVLTRVTDLAGTVGLDHLSLGGSWQVGVTDGSDPFVEGAYRSVSSQYVSSFVVDDTYSTWFPRLLYGTNSTGKCYTSWPYGLRFEIPAELAERHAVFSLATLAESGIGYSYPHETVTLKVNGVVAATLSGLKSGTAVNKVKFPAGTFRAGMNAIQIVNTTDVSKEPTFWGTTSPVLKFAAYRLEFRERRGMMLIVR